MSVENTSLTNVLVTKRNENLEDDGFFSDVQNTSSLSKSQRAMNRFVKSYLLYEDVNDDDTDSKADSAYFSKEGTPNQSVAKFDIETYQNGPSHKEITNITGSTSDSAKTTTNTEDPKTPQKTSNDVSKRKNIVQFIDDCAIDTNKEPRTIARQLFHDKSEPTNPNKNYSKTVDDVAKLSNRTTTYPDVYAPLPYKSPRRYLESDVNIHYKSPVRRDQLPLVPERELAQQQADHMKRLYREQKRTKYLQELQDMQSRRHQDNFTPSQKAVVPLNRYDDADKVVAKALFSFNGQAARELTFRKGDVITVRRQVDQNWYEGELHGKIGLFPYNYVEIQRGDAARSPKPPTIIEGRARAKFDFTAQTNLELPMKKGDVVVLTRRIDHNWWEGRLGHKTGIFPDNYVQILQEPSQSKNDVDGDRVKPVASPAGHGLLSHSARTSMGSHSYTPQLNSPRLSNGPQPTQPLPTASSKSAPESLKPADRGYGPPTTPGLDLNNTEPLYVDTNAEAIPFRVLYAYRPQHADELELRPGDTVYVLERCDDGWLVGSSQRSGRFGTFPGNYVERI